MSKKSSAKKSSKKSKIVEAKIVSYRRNKRLQNTNQAIAQLLDESQNHYDLVGKQFIVEFPDSEKTVKGVVTAVHGQPKSKRIRLKFSGAGMTAHALNQIAKIEL
jgi:ribosomal protein L35AE/L33A